MDDSQHKKVIDHIRKNYKPYTCSWTSERSAGNYDDCFYDGYESGMSWALYEIAQILGIKVEAPDVPDEDGGE